MKTLQLLLWFVVPAIATGFTFAHRGTVGPAFAFGVVLAGTALLIRGVLTLHRLRLQFLIISWIGYLLIAFDFAFLYWLLPDGAVVGPGAPHDSFTFGSALYFSIVTITSTGYGDFRPVSALARVFASTEVLFGVLFFVGVITAAWEFAKDKVAGSSPQSSP